MTRSVMYPLAWKTMRIQLAVVLLLSLSLQAEDPPIEVNPNRPTFANPALTTQPGVAELEWGLQRSTLRDESTAFGTPTLLKLGLVKDLELRLSAPGYLRLAPAGEAATSGPGDLSLGLQWCYLHDGLFGTDQAIQVAHTFPTASLRRGLGNGAPIDTLTLIFSRDAGVDVGLSHGAPRFTVFTGLTVGLGRFRKP